MQKNQKSSEHELLAKLEKPHFASFWAFLARNH